MIGCSSCNQHKKPAINCVCKDHREKIKVPDPVEDLISKKNCRTNNLKKSNADFKVREVYFPISRKARPFFFRVCLRLTLWQETLQFKTVTIDT